MEIAERGRGWAVWPALAIAVLAGGAAVLPWWAAAAAAGGIAAVGLAWRLLIDPRRWLTWFFFAAILLPPLPLGVGNTGPHPAVLLAGLGLLAGVIRLPAWRFHGSAIEWSLTSLLAAMAASVGFAALYSGVTVAAGSAARVLLFGIGAYVYFAAAHGADRQDEAAAMRTTRFLFFLGVAAALFGCVDFLYQLPAPAGFALQFLWLSSGVYRRAQGLFYESSTLGNMCSFFLVLVGVSLTQPRAQRIAPIPALCVGAVLLFSAMLLSFSRASVVACAASLAVLAVVERRRWFRRNALIMMVAFALAAVFAFAAVAPEVAASYRGRVNVAVESFQDAPDRALSGRLESWSRLAAFAAEHPWRATFGIGFKTLPYTEYLGAPVTADNMYLSLLIETGVAGLAALLALHAAIFRVCWRAVRRGSFHGKWLFCFWAGEALQMLSGDILTYWRIVPLFFWVLAQVVREEADANLADRPVR